MWTPRNFLDSLHLSSIDVDWGVRGTFFPEVSHHLFSFIDVQDEVVAPAPEFHLLSVSVLLIVVDQPYHCCVVCVFNDVVCSGLSQRSSE